MDIVFCYIIYLALSRLDNEITCKWNNLIKRKMRNFGKVKLNKDKYSEISGNYDAGARELILRILCLTHTRQIYSGILWQFVFVSYFTATVSRMCSVSH